MIHATPKAMLRRCIAAAIVSVALIGMVFFISSDEGEVALQGFRSDAASTPSLGAVKTPLGFEHAESVALDQDINRFLQSRGTASKHLAPVEQFVQRDSFKAVYGQKDPDFATGDKLATPMTYNEDPVDDDAIAAEKAALDSEIGKEYLDHALQHGRRRRPAQTTASGHSFAAEGVRDDAARIMGEGSDGLSAEDIIASGMGAVTESTGGQSSGTQQADDSQSQTPSSTDSQSSSDDIGSAGEETDEEKYEALHGSKANAGADTQEGDDDEGEVTSDGSSDDASEATTGTATAAGGGNDDDDAAQEADKAAQEAVGSQPEVTSKVADPADPTGAGFKVFGSDASDPDFAGKSDLTATSLHTVKPRKGTHPVQAKLEAQEAKHPVQAKLDAKKAKAAREITSLRKATAKKEIKYKKAMALVHKTTAELHADAAAAKNH